MKIHTKVIIFITSVLLLLSATIMTYALLESRKTYNDINFNVGYYDVTLSGELISDDYLVPGKELIETPYQLINNSTIKIDIQMIIEITLDGLPLNPNEYSNEDGTTNSLIVINSPHTQTGNNYLFENISAGTNIDIINSLEFNGYIVKNLYSGKELQINITFSAKQSENTTWESLGIVKLF